MKMSELAKIMEGRPDFKIMRLNGEGQPAIEVENAFFDENDILILD